MYCTYCGAKNHNNSSVCKKCGVKLFEHKDIKELPYTTLSPLYAKRLEGVKVVAFNSELKQLKKSMENSTCRVCKVLVEKAFLVVESEVMDAESYDKSESYYYANLRTVEGNPISRAIRVSGYFVKKELQEAYVLNYKYKRKDVFLVIESGDIDFICNKIDRIISEIHLETIHRQEPPLEGSLAYQFDKIKNMFKDK